jgi:hypothetical protein
LAGAINMNAEPDLPEISYEADLALENWRGMILEQTKDKRPIFERACVDLLAFAESHADLHDKRSSMRCTTWQ